MIVVHEIFHNTRGKHHAPHHQRPEATSLHYTKSCPKANRKGVREADDMMGSPFLSAMMTRAAGMIKTTPPFVTIEIFLEIRRERRATYCNNHGTIWSGTGYAYAFHIAECCDVLTVAGYWNEHLHFKATTLKCWYWCFPGVHVMHISAR